MDQNNAASIIDFAQKNIECSVVEVGGSPVAISRPAGRALEKLKPFLDAMAQYPERRRGTATLTDLGSFIDHARRFADDGKSALFADVEEEQLIAVLDYHLPGPDGDARWCQHRGIYGFPQSEEWQRWTGSNKQKMGLADFAEFIEQNCLDVLPPEAAGAGAKEWAERSGVDFATPQRLMEVSRNLSVRVTERVSGAVTLQTGECQIQFVAEHSDQVGQPLKVPAAFLLGIPCFRNGEAFQVCARLRYRVKDGVITWWYDLHRTDRVIEVAIQDAARKAQEGTGLPLFFGTPEVP